MKKIFRKKRQEYRKNKLQQLLGVRENYIDKMTED